MMRVRPACRQHLRREIVGDGGAKRVRLGQGGAKLIRGIRMVADVEADIKGFSEARLHRGWPAAGDNGQRLGHDASVPSSSFGGDFKRRLEDASRPPKGNGGHQEDGASDKAAAPTHAARIN